MIADMEEGYFSELPFCGYDHMATMLGWADEEMLILGFPAFFVFFIATMAEERDEINHSNIIKVLIKDMVGSILKILKLDSGI